jgi:hypothetical protein
MHKLEITLKQHTPLIHFQHEQDGATLRATEVKPKLDRFICKHVFNDEFDKAKFFLQGYSLKNEETLKKKFNDQGFRALDYKMKIESSGEWVFEIDRLKIKRNRDRGIEIDRDNNGAIRYEQFPCFFGNMGDEEPESQKKFVFINDPLKIQLSSTNNELLDKKISPQLQKFFDENLFSTRNSKGFGSFLINNRYSRTKYYFDITINQNQFNLRNLKNEYILRGHIIDDAKIIELEVQRELFKQIELFYKVLRSGINMPNKYYIKSPLWAFMASLNIQWDKKSIKHHYFNRELLTQRGSHGFPDVLKDYPVQASFEGNNYFYLIRDMLGLASDAKWERPYRSSITKENNEIDRFKSPIQFKPIRLDNEKWRVNIIHNFTPVEYKNKLFNVKSNNTGTLKLITPDTTIFSLTKYFNFLSDPSFDIEKYINCPLNHNGDYNNDDVIKIVNIFNQIKNNTL